MSKKKITASDFMALIEEESASPSHIAFAPNSVKKNETAPPVISQSDIKENSLKTESTATPPISDKNEIRKKNTHEPDSAQSLINKIETNQRQSRDKVETEPRTQLETKWGQSKDKVETNPISIPKSRDKVETEPRTQLETKWGQSKDKVETNPPFSSLVGLQRSLIVFLYKSSRANRSQESEPLSIEHIAISCETSVSSAKKTLQRLEKKNFFRRSQFKDGRGGWTIYELKKEVFQDLLRVETEDKVETKWGQSRDKVESQVETQPRTTIPYSSSNILNINTTNTEVPENLKRFGISTTNLLKLVASQKTTLEILERSLAALSFDVEHGKTGNLANILFGVLGSGREYISQKYSESLQQELDQELSRIALAEENQKRVVEAKLKVKFKEYVTINPGFIESVKEKHKTYFTSEEILEKMAFEEFKSTLELKS